jgi:hypothetical protein
MIEWRTRADTHEFMCADGDLLQAAVVGEVRDDGV